VLYALVINDYGVLKKKVGQYSEAERLFRESMGLCRRYGLLTGLMNANRNLGILCLKMGNLRGAEAYLRASERMRGDLEGMIGEPERGEKCPRDINHCHLMVLSRQFAEAEHALYSFMGERVNPDAKRDVVLANEFLGELYLEQGKTELADSRFRICRNTAADALSQSDVMTEILRRQADLAFRMGNCEEAKRVGLECVALCKRIGDRHELGAVLRVLGETRSAMGEERKAVSAFGAAIQTLKSIHECYELMRSCIAYGGFLVDRGDRDAEVYLLEARQLCKKLEIDYFAAKIEILLARHAMNCGNYEEARTHLMEAEVLLGGMQACDQKQLGPLLKRATESLDRAVLQTSISAAKELKTICKVYEEARFPIEEIKPDLAYQVTQSVGAESLFLIKRHKRGFAVPLNYNISAAHAKETVRRLDRDRTVPLLGIKGDPRIFEVSEGRTMVAVPTQSGRGYVMCTLFRERRAFSPRQLEFLFASAEAMERLAEDRELDLTDNGNDFIGENGALAVHPRGSFKEILTIDPEMIRIIQLAERASRSEAPILLEGETGVGKELFARAIHESSRRRDNAFIAINAGGMPVNLLESQLFGHVKGAYTDAVTDRIGLVEEARGGTIFFDEVGEMGEELQVKLLRLLENGEFRRLGENKVQIADVRVISATNRLLMREVESDGFRRDLFYRLGTVRLTIPPLRHRQRDIQLLIRHFLKECAARNRMFDRHFQIDVKAMEALELYNWPGNVRELHNEMMRIVSLIGDVDTIRFGMLSNVIKDHVKSKNRTEGLLEESVERYERRLILDALNRNDWNRLRTAEFVGIPRTTLLAKMKRLNIAAR